MFSRQTLGTFEISLILKFQAIEKNIEGDAARKNREWWCNPVIQLLGGLVKRMFKGRRF